MTVRRFCGIASFISALTITTQGAQVLVRQFDFEDYPVDNFALSQAGIWTWAGGGNGLRA